MAVIPRNFPNQVKMCSNVLSLLNLWPKWMEWPNSWRSKTWDHPPPVISVDMSDVLREFLTNPQAEIPMLTVRGLPWNVSDIVRAKEFIIDVIQETFAAARKRSFLASSGAPWPMTFRSPRRQKRASAVWDPRWQSPVRQGWRANQRRGTKILLSTSSKDSRL